MQHILTPRASIKSLNHMNTEKVLRVLDKCIFENRHFFDEQKYPLFSGQLYLDLRDIGITPSEAESIQDAVRKYCNDAGWACTFTHVPVNANGNPIEYYQVTIW